MKKRTRERILRKGNTHPLYYQALFEQADCIFTKAMLEMFAPIWKALITVCEPFANAWEKTEKEALAKIDSKQ